jgi:hypothetical protein
MLVIIQLLLDAFENSFLLYMPPIGFAFFLFTQYGIQAIVVGTLNILILPYPFGYLGKFSNRGRKNSQQDTATTSPL